MIHATRRQKIVCVCVCRKIQKQHNKFVKEGTIKRKCSCVLFQHRILHYFMHGTRVCLCVCVFFMLKNCNNNKNIQNILLYIITQETCIFSVNRIGHRKSRNKNMLFTSMPFGNLLLIIMHVRIYIDDPCECMHVLIIAVYARLWSETERELPEECFG